jgi:hypothetical protein
MVFGCASFSIPLLVNVQNDKCFVTLYLDLKVIT